MTDATDLPGDATGERAHEAVWAALPWLATNRLDIAEADAARAHLVTCDACRRELAAQRALAGLIAAQDAEPRDALRLARALARSRARRATAARRRLGGGLLGGALAAGLALTVALTERAPSPEAPQFRTVTEPAPVAAGALLRARAAEGAEAAALSARFAALGLEVVGEPSAGGVWLLRATDAAAAKAAAAALAREPLVDFVARSAP